MTFNVNTINQKIMTFLDAAAKDEKELTKNQGKIKELAASLAKEKNPIEAKKIQSRISNLTDDSLRIQSRINDKLDPIRNLFNKDIKKQSDEEKASFKEFQALTNPFIEGVEKTVENIFKSTSALPPLPPPNVDELAQEIAGKWVKAHNFIDLAGTIGKTYEGGLKPLDEQLIQALKTGIKQIPISDLPDVIGHLKDFQASSFAKKSPTLTQGAEDIIKTASAAVDSAVTETDKKLAEMEKDLSHGSKDKLQVIKQGRADISIIGGINSDKVRALKNKFQEILSKSSLTPDIPTATVETAEKHISTLEEQIKQLGDPTKFKNINDFIALEQAQDNIQRQMDEIMKKTAGSLQDKIKLDPKTLTFTHSEANITFPTPLSEMFSKRIGVPLRTAMEARGNLQQEFISKSYKVQDYGAGGDCLFHSLGQTTSKDEADTMRNMLAGWMASNKAKFEPLVDERINQEGMRAEIERDLKIKLTKENQFDSYLKWIQMRTKWGGQPEIQAYSDMFGVPVVCVANIAGLNERKVNVVMPEKRDDSGVTIVIQNNGHVKSGGVHFVGLLPK